MSEENESLTTHLLTEIGRMHTSQDRIFDKLSEQGETLVRNTVTLEEHVKRTNLLEKRFVNVETEVDGLKVHVTKINTILNLFKPTKEKLKVLLLLSALAGGGAGTYDLSSKNSFLKTQLEKILK